jgi:hypothetical protein
MIQSGADKLVIGWYFLAADRRCSSRSTCPEIIFAASRRPLRSRRAPFQVQARGLAREEEPVPDRPGEGGDISSERSNFRE